jgi:microcystin-dependent protein
VKAINGFFIDYTNAGSWEQVGTATAQDAADIMQRIFNTLGVDLATIGAIVPFAGGLLPTGWLPADGRSLVRADYADLFSVIGTVWGAADGTHFNIPDLRGQVLLGQGLASSGTTFNLGTNGGEETHTLTSAEVPSHSHGVNPHTHGYSAAAPNATTIGPGAPQPTAIPLPSATSTDIGTSTDSQGGGGAHNNLQPYGVINYAIIAF